MFTLYFNVSRGVMLWKNRKTHTTNLIGSCLSINTSFFNAFFVAIGFFFYILIAKMRYQISILPPFEIKYTTTECMHNYCKRSDQTNKLRIGWRSVDFDEKFKILNYYYMYIVRTLNLPQKSHMGHKALNF